MSAPLPAQRLSDDLSVAPQLDAAAMALAAQAGFKSIINNRPDFEGGPDQPSAAEVGAAARAAGLEYVHQPVAGAYQSPEDIARFKQLVDSLPKPVLAYCRSGARCTKLFVGAQQL
jgi:uncharacterized protein (TIGR01244 family)